ncbi:MAG: hypothetical protein JNK67_05265 [Alphaproteobacteria bacterium]|nr:hypothetical protein [Alphaproteobacteria bacterium]
MNASASDDLAAMARSLRRGRIWLAASLAGLAAAAAMATTGAPTPGRLVVLAGSFAAGLHGLWLGLRVAFDAPIFARWARDAAAGTLDLAAFDAEMIRRRLMPAAKAGRSLAARIAGATGLRRRQAVMLAVQAALLALAGAMRILHA